MQGFGTDSFDQKGAKAAGSHGSRKGWISLKPLSLICLCIHTHIHLHTCIYLFIPTYIYQYIHIYGHTPHDLPRPLFHCKYRQNAYFSWMITSPYFSMADLKSCLFTTSCLLISALNIINMPVLTSKKQFTRSHVTTGETKKTKIRKSKTFMSGTNQQKPKKTLGKPTNPKVWGPSERFWIFGFLDFWF